MVLLTIEICKNFSFILQTKRNTISLKDSSILNFMASVTSLLEAISIIESYVFCCGNEDCDFFDLQAKRNCEFNDQFLNNSPHIM